MNEELKPCPFCGGKAKVKAANKTCTGFTIWCACKCGARTEGFCPDTNKEDDTMENIEGCKKRAAEAWNRRASVIDAQPTAYDVDKVVRQLEELRELDACDFGNCPAEDIRCCDCTQKRMVERAIEIVKGGGVNGKK